VLGCDACAPFRSMNNVIGPVAVSAAAACVFAVSGFVREGATSGLLGEPRGSSSGSRSGHSSGRTRHSSLASTVWEGSVCIQAQLVAILPWGSDRSATSPSWGCGCCWPW
jgi:hypothetical protein